MRFFSFDMDGSITIRDTLTEARTDAEGELDRAKDESADGGWPEETTRISYGVILGEVVETSHKTIEDLEAEGDESAAASLRANGWDYTATHELVEDSPALRDVLAERAKQIAKGYDAAHDDGHGDGELALAAAYFADPDVNEDPEEAHDPDLWWAVRLRAKHAGDRRKHLVLAAAFSIAELERHDRVLGRAAK